MSFTGNIEPTETLTGNVSYVGQPLDDTLTKEGHAAEAKATGDKISSLEQYVDNSLSEGLASKLDKVNAFKCLYATDESGKGINLFYSREPKSQNIPQFGILSQLRANTPSDEEDASANQLVNKGFLKQYVTDHATTKEYVDDYAVKRDKTSAFKVYGVSNADTPVMVPYSTAAGNYTLMYRDNKGCAKVNAPTNDLDAANKKYVDDSTEETKTEISNELSSVIANMKNTIAEKVDKTDTPLIVYGTDATGSETGYAIRSDTTANTVARRNSNGCIATGTPTNDTDAANKKYVDDNAVHTARVSFTLDENSVNWNYYLDTNGLVTPTSGFAVATITIDGTSNQTEQVVALATCTLVILKNTNGTIYFSITRYDIGIEGCMGAVSGYIDVMYKAEVSGSGSGSGTLNSVG